MTGRIRDKKAAARRKGEWVGGTVPCGCKVEKHKLIPVSELAEVVRRKFKRLAGVAG